MYFSFLSKFSFEIKGGKKNIWGISYASNYTTFLKMNELFLPLKELLFLVFMVLEKCLHLKFLASETFLSFKSYTVLCFYGILQKFSSFHLFCGCFSGSFILLQGSHWLLTNLISLANQQRK